MEKQSRTFSTLQRVGRAFMFPIALLPIAGLLLGIGASFTNNQVITTYGLGWIFGSGTFWNFLFTIMKNTGDIIFSNLPLIFAIGIALGMARSEKAVAALSGGIAFLVMHQTINSLLALNGKLAGGAMLDGAVSSVCGIQSLNMGVFGGILIGLIVAMLHEKTYKIKLPVAFSFFGGIRFVPIISTLFAILTGVIMYFVWPSLQYWIFSLGELVRNTGYFGTFIYGLIERALIPFGLHPVFYMPFWMTGVGGAKIIDGLYVSGAQNIFFAELSSPNVAKISIDAARFMAGKFPFMMFGLPAAALAMYHTAKPSKKKVVAGLLASAAFTSFLTGITEPIEFTFLFVSPALYAIHCVFAGLSFMLMHIVGAAVGQTFSGGVIDFFLFGIMQGQARTNWMAALPIMVAYFIVYYFLFRFAITKFNLLTPGREEDSAETKLYTKKDFENSKGSSQISTDKSSENSEDIPAKICSNLGGIENIQDIDCCATRLRVTVKDNQKVDKEGLKATGALGVVIKGTGVQIIYGPRVTIIKTEVEDFITKTCKNAYNIPAKSNDETNQEKKPEQEENK